MSITPGEVLLHLARTLVVMMLAIWPAAGLERAHAEELPTAIPGITVQPNIGEISERARVQFAPNGKYAAVGDKDRIKLWDITSGRPLRILEHAAYFQEFTFIDGGARVLSVHKDGMVRIWDPLTARLVSEAAIDGIEPESHVQAMTHHPGRHAVIITPWNGLPVVLFDYSRMRTEATFPFVTSDKDQTPPEGAVLSSDGKTLIVAGGRIVKRIDTLSGKVVATTTLRKGLQVVRNGVISEQAIIAKSAADDCDADAVLVTLVAKQPGMTSLDKAPGCKREAGAGTDDEWRYDGIVITPDAFKGLVYVARRGVDATRIFTLNGLTVDPSKVAVTQMPGAVVAVDTSGGRVALLENQKIVIRDLAASRVVGTLEGHGDTHVFPIASADGREIMLHHTEDGVEHFTVWPTAGMAPRFHQLRLPAGFSIYHAVPDSNVVLSANGAGAFAVSSILTGEETARFSVDGVVDIKMARLSPDARFAFLNVDIAPAGTGAGEGQEPACAVDLVETTTGRIVLRFKERKVTAQDSMFDTECVASFAFSSDPDLVAVGWFGGAAEIWNIKTGKMVRALAPADDQTTSLTFSPDNKQLLGGSRDSGIFVWSIEDGQLLRVLDRVSVAGHVSTGSVAISHDAQLVAAGPRQRATSSGDIGRERRVQVWDIAEGKERLLLSGHEANVNALVFTANGRWLVSGSNDGTIRYWDRRTGSLAATFAAGTDGRWVIVTDKGFFAAASNAADLLSVVRGFEATSIEQLWQSLYAPDLVRQYLAGTSLDELDEAVAHTDLAHVLVSGPPPSVALSTPLPEEVKHDLIDVAARITDNGKGIGRIEWRVNGVTSAVATATGSSGSALDISRKLALDPGDNKIEVLAYNESNLLASVPTTANVRLSVAPGGAKPKLHILAIGINAYQDKGWVPPGKAKPIRFPPLKLAVNDAAAFTGAVKEAAVGQYSEVKTAQALDQDATVAGLEALVERLAADVEPRDTFLLYVAAHGTSHKGHFYLIPQDFDGGPNPEALAAKAIGQDRLQDWIVNRIRAKRTLVLLDTCESGALVGGYTRSRTDIPASEAAIGRLHEATGRSVLTAAAEGKPAFEGYKGHGVFTWALLDALRNGDRDADGSIELTELVSHVQELVPEIAASLKGRAATAVSVSSVPGHRQSARFGSRGENFQIVPRLP